MGQGQTSPTGRAFTFGVFAFILFAGPSPATANSFLRADANLDGGVDLSDGVRTLGFLFLGEPPLACLDAADANDSGGVDLSDSVFTFEFLFLGGAAPPAPGSTCGEDPTADNLDCVEYPACEDSVTASLTISPTSGPAPLDVRLSGLESSSTCGPILDYAWAFSDGDGASDPLVNHTFEEPGTYTVTFVATAGNGISGTASATVNVEGIRPTTVVATSPTTGEVGVALTRETIIEFRRPVASDDWSEAVVTRFAGETQLARYELSADGRRLSIFYLTPDGESRPLPASARVRVTMAGELIRDDLGRALDGDGNGEEGGVFALDFDTIGLVSIAGTTVTGTVMASERAEMPDGATLDRPLEGVTIRVDGLPELTAVTGPDGHFRLEDAPVGTFFVHIDGHTVTAGVPVGSFYPSVGKPWRTAVAQEIDVGTIFLPLIVDGTLQEVSAATPTEVEFPPDVLQRFPEFEGVRVTVPAGSLFADDGSRGGALGIALVAPDRLPGVLPEQLRFPLVITVQTDGATNLDQPAAVVFPNLPDPVTGEKLEPGGKTTLWSFDHDRGRWEPAGSATVSADGERVVSDLGSGIRAPGWHAVLPANRGGFDPSRYGSDENDGDLLDFLDPPPTPRGVTGVPPVRGEDCAGDFSQLVERVNALSTCAKSLSGVGAVMKEVANQINILTALRKRLQAAQESLDAGRDETAEIERIVAQLVFVKEQLKAAVGKLVNNPATPLGKLTGALDCMKDIAGLLKSECMRAQEKPECLSDDAKKALQGCDEEGLEDLEKAVDALNRILKKFTGFADFAFELACEAIEEAKRLLTEGDGAGAVANPVLLSARLGDILATLEPFVVFEDEDAAVAASFFAVMTDYFTRAGDGYATRVGVAAEAWVSFEYGDVTQRVRADSRGGFSAILPIETPVFVTVFNARTGRIGTSILLTGAPGTDAAIPYPVLAADVSADADSDGLGEAAEAVVGTDPENSDTDGDGISDAAELAQGTDPLDDRIAQSGVISTVPLPDPAKDLCILQRYAVVAHGNSGISVIDVGVGRDPTVIARVDTAGFAQSVACTGSTLVVADGHIGLVIIDASDPPAASIIETLPLGGTANCVAARAGLAFVSAGGRLSVVDVASGAVLDSRHFGATIRDVVLGEDALWVFASRSGRNGSHSVSRLPIRPRLEEPEAHFELTGDVHPAFTKSGLFVDREHVYVAGIYDRPGGVPGVELLTRGESTLELLTSPQPIIAFDVALDGSGHALFAGANSTFGLADVGVLDVSDSAASGNVVGAFPIPGRADTVAVAGGLGYAAADDFHVVSYVAYDALGIPPQIDYAPSALVVARRVEEGKSVTIAIDASDDVQIREVQLFVDDEPVFVDTSYPFDFDIVTPTIAAQRSFALEARATDTGGNQTSTERIEIELFPDLTPPEVTTVSPAGGTVSITGAAEIYVTWSEPLDAVDLNEELVELLGAGVDGEFGTPDDERLRGATLSYRPAIQTLIASFDEPFPPSRYRAALSPSITDLAGIPVASAYEWTFELIDTPDLSRQEFFEIEGTASDDETIHSFLALAGQFVYFDERILCDSADVRWSCVDENGTEIFREEPLEDCGRSDAGRWALERGGRYDIRVTGLGNYRFAIRNVMVTEFDIEISDTVTEDDPAPGAGRLGVPGEIDIFNFIAAPDTEVYFDGMAPECEVEIVWELRDEDGAVLFGNDSTLSGCSLRNQGSVRLERGGLYSLFVEAFDGGVGAANGDIDDGIGNYSFRLWPIQPGAFEIALGDTVAEGSPGPGAGTIETPGNYDVYAFQANAGTTILFDEIAPECSLLSPVWDLFDPGGVALFEGETLEACRSEETITLESSGTYTIIVRAKRDVETTIAYSFRLAE